VLLKRIAFAATMSGDPAKHHQCITSENIANRKSSKAASNQRKTQQRKKHET